MHKKVTRQEALRMERLHDYEWLLAKLFVLQKGIELHFEEMHGSDLDAIDSKVFNGLGSAVSGLQAVAFCLKECQSADDMKFDSVDFPADQ